MKRQIVLLLVAATLLPGQRPSFEVATIKPNDPVRNPNVAAGWSTSRSGLTAVGSLQTFIKQAYGVEDTQIVGGPNWLDRDVFEINAKASAPASAPELKLMLQTLLAERFQLAMHSETRQLSIYSLVVAKGGSKLQSVSALDSLMGGTSSGPTMLRGIMDTATIARSLTSTLGRTVVDSTGLKGSWRFSLTWAPEDQTTGPSLFTAVQEQLGLRLESTKGAVQVFVIDRAEKPSQN